jgi:hypothetical protein
MAIDYGSFEFAAPPSTGTSWILEECERVGLNPQSTTSVFDPFPLKESDKLRVSLICHPCRWLRNIFDMLQRGVFPVTVDLFGFDMLTDFFEFSDFVQGYLKHIPGEVGKVFDDYKCDARMRLEDMPWALVELLESLGVPEGKLRLVTDPGKKFVTDRQWDEKLFQKVMEAESKLCLEYDYF